MSLSQKILLVVAIPIAFQVIGLLGLMALSRQADRYSAAESETAGSTASLDRLKELLIDAQSSVQGYVDTGDEARLEVYRRCLPRIRHEFAFLNEARLIEAQQRRDSQIPDHFDFSGLPRTAAPLLYHFEKQINLVRSGRRDLAARPDQSLAAARLMATFQAEISGNINEERQVEEEQARAVLTARNRLSSFFFAGLVLSVGGLLPLSIFFVHRTRDRLQVVIGNAQRLSRGEVLQAPVRGRDEVALLDSRFHEMALELLHARELLERDRDALADLETQASYQNVELRNLIDEKNRFLGFAAHDLRGPLMAVQTSCAVLQRTPLAEKQALFVERIRNSVTSMSQLVDEFLDVSTLHAIGLRMTRTDISTLVFESLDLHHAIAEQKRLRIVPPSDEPAWLTGDPGKLTQVINNLLSNAIKYSAADRTVTIELRNEAGSIELAVSDEGCGIPLDEMVLLFQPFSKTSAQPTAGETSTGLGLAICRKIVEAHGGRIWAESTVGKGSTFRCSLPSEPTPDQPEEGRSSQMGRSTVFF